MSHKEYALIEYNAGADPQKRETYAKIKQKLIQKQIEKMRATLAKGTIPEETKQFVSKEREVDVTVQSVSDWPKNVKMGAPVEKVVTAEKLQQALEEHEHCEKQEAAIQEYIAYLRDFKDKIKSQIAQLAQYRPECVDSSPPASASASASAQSPATPARTSADLLQELQATLQQKADLDSKILKFATDIMQP